MKSKDIRVGLLLLMANMHSVAGSQIEDEVKQSTDYGWWALVFCAVIGALSTLQWLRIFLIEGLYGMLGRMMKNEATAIRETVNYKSAESQKCDQQTQATEWIDSYIWRQYEEEKEEMEEETHKIQAELLDAEDMIGHLQEDLKEAKGWMFLKSQQHLIKLESKMTHLRRAPSGQVIHFHARCTHWQKAKEAAFCSVCQDEGAVFLFTEVRT